MRKTHCLKVVVFFPTLFHYISEPAPVDHVREDDVKLDRIKRTNCLDSVIPYDVVCYNQCPKGSMRKANSEYFGCNEEEVYHCRPDKEYYYNNGCAKSIECFSGTEAIGYYVKGKYTLECISCREDYFNDKVHASTSDIKCEVKDICKHEYILCDSGSKTSNVKCSCNTKDFMKPIKENMTNCQLKDELRCKYVECPEGSTGLGDPPDYNCIRDSPVIPPQPTTKEISHSVTADIVPVIIAEKALDESCDTATECLEENALCIKNRCSCPNTMYRSDQNCLEFMEFNGTCIETKQCLVVDSVCLETRCVCQDEYRYDKIKNSCIKNIKYISHDDTCTVTTQCSTFRSECYEKTCMCIGEFPLYDKQSNECTDSELTKLEIILIAVGLVIFLLLCVLGVLCVIYRKKIKKFSCCKDDAKRPEVKSKDENELEPLNGVGETPTFPQGIPDGEGEDDETSTSLQDIENEQGRQPEAEPLRDDANGLPYDVKDMERNKEFLKNNPDKRVQILFQVRKRMLTDLLHNSFILIWSEKYTDDWTEVEMHLIREITEMQSSNKLSSEINAKILELAQKTGVEGYYKFKSCLEGELLETLDEAEKKIVANYQTSVGDAGNTLEQNGNSGSIVTNAENPLEQNGNSGSIVNNAENPLEQNGNSGSIVNNAENPLQQNGNSGSNGNEQEPKETDSLL